jgi:hypothetical protein
MQFLLQNVLQILHNETSVFSVTFMAKMYNKLHYM